MSLLNRYEEIKKGKEKLDDLEQDLRIKNEVAELVKSILNGQERYYSERVEVFEKFNIRYKKDYIVSWMGCRKNNYSCKITKTLIKKVEEYLESENEYE